ncbi:MAG: PAS domain S-box protein [Chloroflexota bacterium]
MSDETMSREELLAEVGRLRRRVAELEAPETRQVQAEQALHQSEARLARAQEIGHLGSWDWDVTGETLLWSDELYRIWGVETDFTLTFENIVALIHPEDRQKNNQTLQELFVSLDEGAFEFRIVRPDGQVRHIHQSIQVSRNAAGQAARMFGIMQDITDRVQAERALAESEERLRLALEAANDGLWDLNLKTGEAHFGPRYFTMLGYEPGEFASSVEVWLDLIHPDDRPRALEVIFNAIEGNGEGFGVEFRLRTKGGDWCWVLDKGKVVAWDENGIPRRMVGVHVDITDRVQAEQQLRQSEARYRAIVAQAYDGISVVNEQGRVMEWNQAMETITGLKAKDVLGQPIWDVQLQTENPDQRTPERYQQLKTSLTQFSQTGQAPWANQLMERQYMQPDGSRTTVQGVVSVVETDQGFLLLSTCRDVTTQKRAEQSLRESYARFLAVLDGIEAHIYAADLDSHRILYMNRRMSQDFGADLTGEICYRVFRQEPVSCAHCTNDRLLDAAGRPGGVYIWEGLNPITGRWYMNHDRAIPWVDGRMVRLQVAVDITERIQAERTLQEVNGRLEETLTELQSAQEQLVQQERLAAVGQLAAGIAHDFNNILAVIVLYTHIALRDTTLSPELRERLKIIDRQAKRATDLVQQILDFSRRAVLRRQDMDLAPFLEEGVKLLKRTLPESIQLELSHGPGVYAIQADVTRVQQVLMNLALNARDAMPHGGRLRVGLERLLVRANQMPPLPEMAPGHWVCLSVADTGAGIAPEVLPHIFEPFFTTKLPHGSGLGLAQVYGIVRQHGGYIDVETELGRGATFRIYWPALPGDELAVSEEEETGLSKGRRETVLVVEDDPIVRQVLVDCLEMLNYGVLEAANGEEALQVLDRRGDEIALVLSDWVMPVMSGGALAQHIRQRQLAVKMVIVTGYPLDELYRDGDPEIVAAWVQKPPSLEQLAEALARALRNE